MKHLCALFGLLGLLTVAASAAATLKPGDPAPLFEAKDQAGVTWKLADYLGKDDVIVYFYPKDDSPGCTIEACGFRDRLAELKRAGVVIVGVSRDGAASHEHFADKFKLGFPLLVDTDGKLADAFGATAPGRPHDRRVSFLIGHDRRVVHVTDNRDANVHLAELKQAVAQLKS